MLAGYLLGRTGLFYWPLVIAAIVSLIGALSWLFVVGPVEPVEWERKIRPPFGIGASPATGAARP
jgi:hypothetical protein